MARKCKNSPMVLVSATLALSVWLSALPDQSQLIAERSFLNSHDKYLRANQVSSIVAG